ncbi:MAG: hypothetical protein AAF664_08800, partial [Planctomycetota bacterium]
LIEEEADNATAVTSLFLRALSRPPTDTQLQTILETMKEYGNDRRQALEDVAWSLLTSTEFTFNH